MPIAQRLQFIAVSAFLALATSGCLCAQGQPDSRLLRGPVIGFVHDETVGIRPVLGIPGAATLGPAVLARAAFESVAVAADRDYALAVLARSRQVAVVRNLSTSASTAVLDVPAGPARIALSPSGDAAAFYYSAAARVEVLTGLPNSPSAAWNSSLAGAAGGLAALALSDGGGALLFAAAGDPAPIWLASAEAGPRVVHTASSSPSLAFLSGSEDAAIADALTGEVVLVRDLKGEPRFTRLGGAAEGISRPVAIAATPDNRRLLVASAAPGGVVGLGLSGEDPFRVACSCAPATLERMASGTVFRLSEAGSGPVWLLDARGSTPRIVFVPDRARALRGTGRETAPPRNGGGR